MADDDASPPGPSPRRRRKDARPAEIVAVATALFIERGFAATRMETVAERAGVAKGTVFRYFATKEALFRAVAAAALSDNLALLEAGARRDAPLAETLPALLAGLAQAAGGGAAAVAAVVLAEARTFPDIARAWHDEVANRVLSIVAGLIERGQARGEVRPGDSRALAFGVIGPVMMGALFARLFAPVGATPPDVTLLAREHGATLMAGMLTPTPKETNHDAP